MLLLLPDAWMARCLAPLQPQARIATFGGARERALFPAEAALVVEPRGERSAPELLACPEVEALIGPGTEVLTFKPSQRVEERVQSLGGRMLLAPAHLARGLENKNALPGIAAEAGVPVPKQRSFTRAAALGWPELAETFGTPLVAQSPRGFMGRKTWSIPDEPAWLRVAGELGPRPVKVAAFAVGRPATVNAVVDRAGRVVVTAPIVQVTGEPWLTPFPLGSCGNDFTWRGLPDPTGAAETIAVALGPVLARRGYRGHFGIDLVALEGGGATLIEINPRLTASFALYSAFCPALLEAHLLAVRDGDLRPTLLPPIEGGQLIVHNTGSDPVPPIESGPFPIGIPPEVLTGTTLWPYPGPLVESAGTRARLIVRGPVVDERGRPLTPWRP